MFCLFKTKKRKAGKKNVDKNTHTKKKTKFQDSNKNDHFPPKRCFPLKRPIEALAHFDETYALASCRRPPTAGLPHPKTVEQF